MGQNEKFWKFLCHSHTIRKNIAHPNGAILPLRKQEMTSAKLAPDVLTYNCMMEALQSLSKVDL